MSRQQPPVLFDVPSIVSLASNGEPAALSRDAFMEDLFAIVRRNEVETMLHNARLTRDWPEADEKRTEAERQVRLAMYRFALGQMTDEQRRQILEILRPCCPNMFFMQPPIEDRQPVLSPPGS